MSHDPSAPYGTSAVSLQVVALLTLLLGSVATPARAQEAPAVPAAADTVAVDRAATDTAGVSPLVELAENQAEQASQLLQERMRRVFAQIAVFEGVRVTVQDGVVRLEGEVPQADAADEAAELARQFEGVLYVENDLASPVDVEARVTPALQEIQDLVNGFVAYLPLLAIALLVLLAFTFAGRFVRRWTAPYERLGVSPLVHSLLRRVLGLVVILIGAVLALNILDATALVGAVLGTAGIAGLAIGFAFQDIVENYLAGALLSLRRPFAMDDHILIEGHEGRVVSLTAREMVLMTLDGNHVRLPNSVVFKGVLTNFTRNPRRRFDFIVGVGTEEDLVEAMQVGQQVLKTVEGVMEDPAPFALVEELGDSNVAVRFFGWVDQRRYSFGPVRSRAVRLVKTAMDEAGVEMPEPIYRVHLTERTRAAAGAPAEAEPAPRRPTGPAPDDLSMEEQLDAQVEEDLARSDVHNALEEEDRRTDGKRGAHGAAR